MASKAIRDIMDEEYEYEIPTSMIDVVFLLLIFFMCSTRFRSVEKKLDADLPKNEGQNAIPTKVEIPTEIRVRISWINGKGQVISSPNYGDPNDFVQSLGQLSVVGARIRIQANRKTCTDLHDLYLTLAELGARNPEMPVVIDARQKVPFRWVIGAIDACKRANIGNIKFQAPPVEGGGGDDWWWK